MFNTRWCFKTLGGIGNRDNDMVFLNITLLLSGSTPGTINCQTSHKHDNPTKLLMYTCYLKTF